ncbi:unnamed protein product, partial [marine sediment metagenome]
PLILFTHGNSNQIYMDTDGQVGFGTSTVNDAVEVSGTVDSTGGYEVDNSAVIDGDGFFKPKSSADAAAPNNSIYYSTDASKLVYKDSGGTVNNLY